MVNPMQMIQMMQNPQQFIENLMNNSQAMQNPIMKNAMDMYRKGDMQGLNNLVNNVAKERGTTIEEVKKKIGIQ